MPSPRYLTRAFKRGAKAALISSRMDSIGDNGSAGYYGYRMIKAALNAARVSLAHELKPSGVALKAGCLQVDSVGIPKSGLFFREGDTWPASSSRSTSNTKLGPANTLTARIPIWSSRALHRRTGATRTGKTQTALARSSLASGKDVSLKDARLAPDAVRLRVKGDRTTFGVAIVREKRAARDEAKAAEIRAISARLLRRRPVACYSAPSRPQSKARSMAVINSVDDGLLITHRIPAAATSAAVLAAVNAGKEKGANVSAVVADHNNVRIAFLRGDGAGRHTEDVSLAKAYAAVSFAPIYSLSASGPGCIRARIQK
jgi:hypothetical protein